MSISFSHTLEIPEAPDAIWAVIDDPRRTPEWLDRCTAMEVVTPGAVALGTGLRYSFRDSGRDGVMDGEVTAWEPNARLTMRFTDRTMLALVDFRLTATTTGTALTHVITLTPRSILTKLFAPLIRSKLPGQTIEAMHKLHHLVHDKHLA